jgi:hypothetical protein
MTNDQRDWVALLARLRQKRDRSPTTWERWQWEWLVEDAEECARRANVPAELLEVQS